MYSKSFDGIVIIIIVCFSTTHKLIASIKFLHKVKVTLFYCLLNNNCIHLLKRLRKHVVKGFLFLSLGSTPFENTRNFMGMTKKRLCSERTLRRSIRKYSFTNCTGVSQNENLYGSISNTILPKMRLTLCWLGKLT